MALRRIGRVGGLQRAARHGGAVCLPGQISQAPEGRSVGAQTHDILGQIDRLLDEAGTGKSRLLAANIRLADMAAFAEMDAVWNAWLPRGLTPSRATVEAKLDSSHCMVEIAVVAAL